MDKPTRVKLAYAVKALKGVETASDAMQAALVVLEIAGALCKDWELGCLELDDIMDPIATFLADVEDIAEMEEVGTKPENGGPINCAKCEIRTLGWAGDICTKCEDAGNAKPRWVCDCPASLVNGSHHPECTVHTPQTR